MHHYSLEMVLNSTELSEPNYDIGIRAKEPSYPSSFERHENTFNIYHV